MTRELRAHPTDEQLALYADGASPDSDARNIESHLSQCPECRIEVEAARKGLRILVLATDPPPRLEELAKARLWSASRSVTPLETPGDSADEFREVVGRDLESDQRPSTDEAEPTDE